MPALKWDLSRCSFGITSAIVTSLALMMGLDQMSNAKTSIIGALLIIAIADNISDSLGIHVYRESQIPEVGSDPRVYTVSNFLARLVVMMVFITLIVTLPLAYATALSVAVGLVLLTVLSYYIALYQKTSPLRSIAEHLVVAVFVIIISHFLGMMISRAFNI
jgi:VIT1/CCC1 family predicted Fe2+/Mn2+ transporter